MAASTNKYDQGIIMKVEFYSLKSNNKNLKFVVIQARYQGKWIFVRHKDRTTWEIPGGHIEEGEDVDSAAGRELAEESGATDYTLEPICNYSVESEKGKSFGRLYYAEVYNLGKLEHEIEEICFQDKLPDQLTYEIIQPFLYEQVIDYIKKSLTILKNH